MDPKTQALLASLLTMAWFVEARDPYTGGHLWRVSRYAQLVAERSDLGGAVAARIALGGFLHDLGKIGVPDAILRKTGKLSEEEYEVIKTHPGMGERMLAGHPLAALVHDAVLLHHERPDGCGYPSGLAAPHIPDMALIVGVCDAFDAMTSHRPYRAGMPIEKALALIDAEKGRQFDARFADALIALGSDAQLLHVAGHSDEGIPLQSCPSCGPTLALTRESQAGQLIYCRNCCGQFKLARDSGGLHAEPTGAHGRPADLEPAVDLGLIRRTVGQAAATLPADVLTASLLTA
ncbi:MAG: HD-GYP domain-containing protein [Burkholderiaceae bacterium]|nr:HD-GYP domain-containing protein [Burkholderiaceae bacterium]